MASSPTGWEVLNEDPEGRRAVNLVPMLMLSAYAAAISAVTNSSCATHFSL